MQYTGVVKRAGQLAWRYRALWFFGALLALTTATLFPFWMGWDHEGEVTRIPVRITRETTIYLPGEGVRIDLTRPGGFLVETGGGRWTSLGDLLRDIGPVRMPRDGWVILGVLGGVVTVPSMFGLLSWSVLIASLLIMFGGLLLFGLTAMQKRPLPRGNYLPVIAGLGFPAVMIASDLYEAFTGTWLEIGSAITVTIIGVTGLALLALGRILRGEAVEAPITAA